MAIVLMEEVLMGLDEVKESLDLAVLTLENILDDLSPSLRHDLHDVLEKEMLQPLQSRRDALDNLLFCLAEPDRED